MLACVAAVSLVGLWRLTGDPAGSPSDLADTAPGPLGSASSERPVPNTTGARGQPTPRMNAEAPSPEPEDREVLVPTAKLTVQVTAKKFAVPGRAVSVAIGPSDTLPTGATQQLDEVTNRAGLARFDVPAGMFALVKVPRGDEMLPLRRTVQMDPMGTEVRIRMELEPDVPSARITVALRSIPGGEPLSGARVSALRKVGYKWNVVVGRTAVTNELGEAEVPWADDFVYEAVAPGHSPWVEPAASASDGSLSVELVRHARLHGQLSHPLQMPFAEGRPPRILFFSGISPAAAAVTELVDDLRAEPAEDPENLMAETSGLIVPQARLDLGGRWEIRSIPFPRDQLTQTECMVRFDQGEYSRAVAGDLIVRAGEDRLVQDRWPSAVPLDARCVDAKGQPLDIALEAYLRRLDGSDLSELEGSLGGVWVSISRGGRLQLPWLRQGEWAVVDPFSRDEDLVLGTFHHEGEERQQITVTVDPIPKAWLEHVR